MTALTGFGDTFESDLLQLILNATPIANIADNAAAGPLTVLELTLHTADPGEDGVQTTNEIAYTGWARIPINRDNSTKKWTVANPATNVDVVTAGAFTGGSQQVATHFSLGTAHVGAGKILAGGPLTNPVTIGLGNPIASFAAGQLSASLV
jgi:hypothetical protein